MPDTSKRTAILKALSGAEQRAIPDEAGVLQRMAREWAAAERRSSTGIGDLVHEGDTLIPASERTTPVPPPPPGIFQPDPSVVGSPHLAQVARALLDRAPDVKARVGSITAGPVSTGIQDILEDPGGWGPEDLYDPNLNIMGETSVAPGKKEIGLNAGRSDNEQVATLIHELTHAAGNSGEAEPRAGKASWLNLLRQYGYGTQPAQGGRGVR